MHRWQILIMFDSLISECLQLGKEVPLGDDPHLLDLTHNCVVYHKLRLNVLHLWCG